MKTFSTFLHEAAFSKKDLVRAKKLIVRILQRRTGMIFYPYGKDGIVRFKVRGVVKTGMQYFLGNTDKSIRFNWTKKNGREIESISIWNGKSPGDKPTVNLDMRGKNVVQLLDLIVAQIKAPRVGVHQIAINEAQVKSFQKMYDISDEELKMFEARKLGDEVQSFIDSIGISIADFQRRVKEKDQKLINAKNTFVRKMKKQGFGGAPKDLKNATMAVVVSKGVPEIAIDPESDKFQKQAESKIPPDELFQDLEDLLDLVISGKQPSLLVTGTAGSGKTTVVEKKLKDAGKVEGKDWVGISGASSPFGLYSALFLNRTKIVVFDDTDSVFSDEKARNILKAALDSKDVRKLSWFSKTTIDKSPDEITQDDLDAGKFPNQFEFTGQVIFISNLPQAKIDPAIRSRSFTIDISLTQDDMITRMQGLKSKIRSDLNDTFKQEVIDQIKKGGQPVDKDVNMRTMLGGIRIREGGSPRWKILLTRYA